MLTIFRDGIKAGSLQLNGDGSKTIEREIIFEYEDGDTDLTVSQSVWFPKIGQSLPQSPSFYCTGVSSPEWSDSPRHVLLRITYQTKESANINIGNGDVKPWEMGIQEIQKTDFQINGVLENGYILEGNDVSFFEMKNTAGDSIQFECSYSGTQYTFRRAYKGDRLEDFGDTHSINSEAVTIAGIGTIEPYCGKMLMPQTTLYNEYDENGRHLYTYTVVQYTLQIHPKNWSYKILNVGTRARFGVGSSYNFVQPIYQYTPWTSTDIAQQTSTKPRFGSLATALEADQAYRTIRGDSDTAAEHIPIEEIREPLPLTEQGGVSNDMTYIKFQVFDVEPESWAKFDLPQRLGK